MAGDFAFIRFTLNGAPQEVHVRPEEMLVQLLRDRLQLTGTKIACDVATCGACTVLIDGKPSASCATFAWQAEGAEIVTIEGLADPADGSLESVQQAFVDTSAFQCGFCTPGMILLAKALIDRNPSPDRDAIRNWMGANICRCTGYEMIIEAVEKAAAMRREGGR